MKTSSQQVHRPGPLKQENKPHKVGRHRSNRSISAENKGKKLDVKTITKHKADLKKHERRNQLNQLRKKKREETFMAKRSLGRESTPPILVAILDLSSNKNQTADDVIKLITNCDDNASVVDDRYLHVCVPRFKLRYEFIIIDKNDLMSTLDAVKVADILLIIHPIPINDDNDDDDESDYNNLLEAIYCHCLPTTIHIVNGISKIPVKKQNEMKKVIQKSINERFPDEKLRCVENHSDALQLMNQIGNCKRKQIAFRKYRPQLLAEKLEFESETNESLFGTLKVSGYVRNCCLDVNSIVHIPGWGDFHMTVIESVTDPFPIRLNRNHPRSDQSYESKIIQQADPRIQQSLESENIPDPMDSEQTWPTAEELTAAEHGRKLIKKVPKGTSDYQAAWIFDDEDYQTESESEDDDDDDDDDEGQNTAKDMDVEDETDSNDDEDKSDDENDEEEMVTMSVTEGEDVKYDEKMDLNEEDEAYKKFKEQKMDEMFPDEIDTPQDVGAKIRFARYRGLKSFRTSHWDPKENLPPDYGRIYQFENYDRTKRRVLKQVIQDQSGAHTGWFVCVYVDRVPKKLYEYFSSNKTPLLLYGLLPYEQRMSVMNLVIKKHHSCQEPIKSKDKLIFHLGCRRFSASPILSAHTNADKHKLERFLKPNTPTVATVYAPIVFRPMSVLVYKTTDDGSHTLVATGFLLNCDPDRIVVKRIVLSGHPFKINKKTAVVRYMFFNRDDILWFKPVELRTKYGRRGHIKEPLGTHGHMKCTFDKQLMSQDVVLMNLYKRVFPKWTYDPVLRK